MNPELSIIPAEPIHLPEIKALFREYETFLGVDLCFQGFEEELAELPGKYKPPRGALLVAFVNSQVAGCVALRPLDNGHCEMKRLFVRPDYRGLGLGRQLAHRIIEVSRDIGYERMKLDTLDFLEDAIHLYKSLGFKQTGSYYDNPLEKVSYWELDLT
ncbi:MAG: GNAT family N-acetyltransferase [Arenicellales bacterium]|nr:GNAT family N-acetyltransferase [Arenicellales bacterium]